MQYVRSLGGSVSKTWNSINPATLSGAIDVIVVEQEDGSLACSPFHVRFGKISLLRPYDKKVEFKVNNVKQDYSMKLGEGGEAFFVFETSSEIPESLQTSPLISPAGSPSTLSVQDSHGIPQLQEPEFLDLGASGTKRRPMSTVLPSRGLPFLDDNSRAQSDLGNITPLSTSPKDGERPASHWAGESPPFLRSSSLHLGQGLISGSEDFEDFERPRPIERVSEPNTVPTQDQLRSTSPYLSTHDALNRAMALSKKLSATKIPTHVTETGDLMLDMNGYKSSEKDALRAEVIARQVLAEELEGNYDIGALIGADERGNLWIYSSEEAKEAALRKLQPAMLSPRKSMDDAASDPGYHSDDDRLLESSSLGSDTKTPVPPLLNSDTKTLVDSSTGLQTPPHTPPNVSTAGDPNRNYAKTLRLTSDQLRALNLKPGQNSMSFTVNKATCQASMFYWTCNTPVVISDIDGTITKSDALGHVLNMIGRDWTHLGVAKLYRDIVANGYNIFYLTSRSVGQADTTRNYLNSVVQDGYRLPKGPVILSPDRTVAALRREVYLRKPEVFKMACLRDIMSLYGERKNAFYAGFGNRFTDALSYRSVNIPSNRIFTINSNAEVALDLLTLSKYRSSYVSMQEILDHFFPPVGLLVASGGEDYTDFNYWRQTPLELDDFSASESDDDSVHRSEDEGSEGDEDYDEDDEAGDAMTASYISQDSLDEGADLIDSINEQMTRRVRGSSVASSTPSNAPQVAQERRGRSPARSKR